MAAAGSAPRGAGWPCAARRACSPASTPTRAPSWEPGSPGPPTEASATGPESTPISAPPPPATAPAIPKTSFLASRSGVPIAPASRGAVRSLHPRARNTTTRPVPVPSALFEAPTAADIDKALEVLQEAPGPAPAARPVPSAPRYVADDASNEPTRVGGHRRRAGRRRLRPARDSHRRRGLGADDRAALGRREPASAGAGEPLSGSLPVGCFARRALEIVGRRRRSRRSPKRRRWWRRRWRRTRASGSAPPRGAYPDAATAEGAASPASSWCGRPRRRRPARR